MSGQEIAALAIVGCAAAWLVVRLVRRRASGEDGSDAGCSSCSGQPIAPIQAAPEAAADRAEKRASLRPPVRQPEGRANDR